MIVLGRFVGDFWDILSDRESDRDLPYTDSKKKIWKKQNTESTFQNNLVKVCRDDAIHK